MVMSNELATPKVLNCPSDSYSHQIGTNFNQTIYGGNAYPPVGKQGAIGQVSYFVSGDATESDPQMIMAGDENIGNATTVANGASGNAFTTTAALPQTPAKVDSENFSTGATPWGTAAGAWAWTADFHQKNGNLMIADGSVQQVSISALHTAMLNSTNTVAVQSWNFPM
jgi:hypothetical protein